MERFHNRRPHYITDRDSSTAEQLVTCLFAKHVKEFYIAAVNFFVIHRVDHLDASISSPVQKHRNTAFASSLAPNISKFPTRVINTLTENLRCEELLHGHVPLRRNLLVGSHLGEALDHGAGVVERVGASELLGEAVLVPRELEDGAACATRDDTGTRTRGSQHDNRAAAPLDGYPVGKGGTLRDGHRHHGLARVGGGFGHRDLDLSRLGASDADLTGAVADHDGGAEAHVGATLGHFRDALHLDDVLGEAVALGLAAAASASASASAGC